MSKDPLHGITLEHMLTELVKEHGWEDLSFRIRINCFINNDWGQSLDFAFDRFLTGVSPWILHLTAFSGGVEAWNGNLVGIVSWTDLMRVSLGDAFGESTASVDATLDHSITLEQLMESDPVTLDHTATVRDAAIILSKADFHSLPVVDGQHLVGIVTTTDLISYLIDRI